MVRIIQTAIRQLAVAEQVIEIADEHCTVIELAPLAPPLVGVEINCGAALAMAALSQIHTTANTRVHRSLKIGPPPFEYCQSPPFHRLGQCRGYMPNFPLRFMRQRSP